MNLNVFDASAVYMNSLNPGKMAKKVVNRIDFDTRITNICFSKIFDQ